MNSTISSSELNAIENHDDFIIVWLDSSVDIPTKLENMTDFLHIYSTFEECEDYLETIQSDRKVLLVLAEYHVYALYCNGYPQVQSIYILNKNPQHIDSDIEKCSKLVHVFHDECALIERLHQDIIFTYRHDLSISISLICEITNDQSWIKLENNKLFFWNQAILYYLVDASNVNMDELKTSMIEQCRLEYQNSPSELRKIDDFAQNCTSADVLRWYTKDSFVYRLVNKAFRSRNLDLICKLRYAIILLYEKLKELSIQQQKESLTTVYRAQCLKKNELELLKANIGQLIATNTMMSTTRNRNVANIYQDPKAEVSVILEINITVGNNIIYPFADISSLSNFSEESEVLFFAGAVFRIDSVEIENNSTYIIKLTLSNEKLKFIEQLTNACKVFMSFDIEKYDISWLVQDAYSFKKYHLYLTERKLSSEESMLLISRIFSNDLVNHVNDASTPVDYYKQLLSIEYFLVDPKRTSIGNTIIGKNYFRSKEYDKAFIYYGLALSLLDDKNRLTGEVYHLLGDIWKEKNQDETVLSCYIKASSIVREHDDKEKTLIELYTKIAEIYSRQNYNEDAKTYGALADEIVRYQKKNPKYIDTDNIMRYKQQYNIQLDPAFLKQAYNLYLDGMHILPEKKFSKGLKCLKRAEKMFKKHYFRYSRMLTSIIAVIYEHQALAHLGSKDCFNAIVAWKKAIDLRMIYKL